VTSATAVPGRAARLRAIGSGLRGPGERSRGISIVLAAVILPFLHAGAMAAAGFGFILDDWYTLRNAYFDGAFAAAGGDQLLARPGAWFTYGVVFGILDGVPLLILVLMAAVRSATAVVLWVLLGRFVPLRTASVVALVWVVLPVTSSLEFWASGANISLALLFAAVGCLSFDRALRGDRMGAYASPVSLVIATLLYEAVVPVAAVGVVAVVLLHLGWDLARTVRSLAPPLLALGGASLWVLVNWNPAKSPREGITDFSPFLGANFGWGVFGDTSIATIAFALILVVSAWSVATLVAPSVVGRSGVAEKLVAVGAVVIAVSLIPFVFYTYEPMGVGDRVNVTTSIGAAMVWTGAGLLLWRLRPELAIGAGMALLVGSTLVRVDRIQAYSWAAAEADRITASVPCAEPTGGVYIAGPRPEVRSNVTSFIDSEDHLQPAVQLTLDDPHAQVRVILDAVELARAGGADISLTEPKPCDASGRP